LSFRSDEQVVAYDLRKKSLLWVLSSSYQGRFKLFGKGKNSSTVGLSFAIAERRKKFINQIARNKITIENCVISFVEQILFVLLSASLNMRKYFSLS
jgi:hypothetical protein